MNLKHESAKLKIEYHRHVFEKIWSSMVGFLNLIRHLNPKIAIEWPAHCIYWKLDRVEKFCGKHQLIRVTVDGCMVGIVDKEGVPIKKLSKLIVIQLSLLLMDCHVMEVIPMFKVGVMILRKQKAIHSE